MLRPLNEEVLDKYLKAMEYIYENGYFDGDFMEMLSTMSINRSMPFFLRKLGWLSSDNKWVGQKPTKEMAKQLNLSIKEYAREHSEKQSKSFCISHKRGSSLINLQVFLLTLANGYLNLNHIPISKFCRDNGVPQNVGAKAFTLGFIQKLQSGGFLWRGGQVTKEVVKKFAESLEEKKGKKESIDGLRKEIELLREQVLGLMERQDLVYDGSKGEMFFNIPNGNGRE